MYMCEHASVRVCVRSSVCACVVRVCMRVCVCAGMYAYVYPLSFQRDLYLIHRKMLKGQKINIVHIL